MVQEKDTSEELRPLNGSFERMHLDISIAPDSREVPAARRAVQGVCRGVGISEDHCADLDLALGEALANAVVHGTSASVGSKPHAKVHISVWDFQSSLIVEVRDTGSGFAPPPPPYAMPSPDLDATHGRGLPLMEMLTDALMVCQGDALAGGSSIFLIKAKIETLQLNEV